MEHCNCDKDSINSSTEKSEDFEEMVSNDSNYMPLKKKTSIIVNKCIIEEKFSIKASIDFGGNINGISQKIINELDLTYHNESNSAELQTPLASYSILGKFKFRLALMLTRNIKVLNV
ncbi:uncharacterized protein OCT59_005539 [Rhizophagus irregularis]|uniref:uncharacterized protein n=1 Tax=Rhizophagus irregularis TaxID=588596 RepID=UPI00331D2039|nr:hypothetical protein OCT59_005539 [Rhizophagus irregularis]